MKYGEGIPIGLSSAYLNPTFLGEIYICPKGPAAIRASVSGSSGTLKQSLEFGLMAAVLTSSVQRTYSRPHSRTTVFPQLPECFCKKRLWRSLAIRNVLGDFQVGRSVETNDHVGDSMDRNIHELLERSKALNQSVSLRGVGRMIGGRRQQTSQSGAVVWLRKSCQKKAI